ncbi:MAG: hypothetical protein EOO01_25035 [Chitinophagaceae bacterium]|nr:MAG: hypothetical protein EOO01_25035 [Chitinophagaceae bacterium]
MNKDLQNILSNLNKDSGQEKLLEYLNKQLDEAGRHEFEKQLLDDEFMNDAVEGLDLVENKDDIPLVLQQLNQGLKSQLASRKNRKRALFFNQPWAYVAVIVILLLLVAAFLLLRKIGNQ